MIYLQYNFFDYDTDHPDLSTFDIHQCYSPEQSEELVIVFPGNKSFLSLINLYLCSALFSEGLFKLCLSTVCLSISLNGLDVRLYVSL